MSQEQPQKTAEPIKYGDVFPVSGDLASKVIAPKDAVMMQTAENLLFGQTQKGGTAAVLQSSATRNERAGVVGHKDVTDLADNLGVTVTETELPGKRIVTESVAGQVLEQYTKPSPLTTNYPAGALEQDSITIGEALEATAMTAGHRPIDESDAAAIQTAEMRATGSSVMSPEGVAAKAQSAASVNARMLHDEDKTKLADVLTDATTKLSADKAVTKEDAEGVMGAELRNNPHKSTRPGGVAASMAAAARVNQNR